MNPLKKPHAPVAQLDRVPDYESGGRRFESFLARHIKKAPVIVWGFFAFRNRTSDCFFMLHSQLFFLCCIRNGGSNPYLTRHIKKAPVIVRGFFIFNIIDYFGFVGGR